MAFDWHFTALLQWIGMGAVPQSEYLIARWLFLRVLGIIYLIAFISLWVQVKGLMGGGGILPAREYLDALRPHYGPERYSIIPTVFWFGASDVALQLACGLGALAAVLLVLGIAPLPCLVVLWVLYLSLTSVGRDFLSFQWDVLLLEVGFLAIFLAPLGFLPGLAQETAVPPLILLLFWWLLFRFMFESGIVKLLSGDSSWKDLSALDYHYFTQPLPVWTSWYMHHLPAWFQRLSTLFMYAVELLLPFLLFTVRPLKLVAVAGIALLNLLIFATGNYTFFNLLTVTLCILALDDGVWFALLPQSFLNVVGDAAAPAPLPPWWLGACALVALLYLCVSVPQFLRTALPSMPMPRVLLALESAVQPLRSINRYGLFRVMTKTRMEIVVEGSDDGVTWRAYEFRHKPGDLARRPDFVEPHQPRLDWQMWFAALGNFHSEPWFQAFLIRLLEGSPDVLALLGNNPFPDSPPRYVRALIYEYGFTSAAERKQTGHWWHRGEPRIYAPPLSLRGG